MPEDPAPVPTVAQPVPAHRRPALVLAVLAGGLVGTPARYAVAQALPGRGDRWPTATFIVNLVGAFLLGLLLEALARRGDDTGWRQLLRLGLGTGLIGSFTTYSALAVDTDLLVRAHRPGLAAVYAIGSVVLGVLLAAAGVAVGTRR